MRLPTLLLAFFFLTACTHEGARGDYTGSDAGHLVVTLTRTPGMNLILYSLDFHNKESGATASVWWGPDNTFEGRKPEIDDGKIQGLVEIHTLPPGAYVLDNFTVDDGAIQWSAKKSFAVPFTIKPNQTTYLGDFTLVVVLRKNFFGLNRMSHFYFVPSDHKDRDISIASRIALNLGPVIDATPSAKAFDDPLVHENMDEK